MENFAINEVIFSCEEWNMGKDNFDIQRMVDNLAADKLDAAQDNAHQQLLTALCIMVVGLILTITGFMGLVLKLGKLARVSLLFASQPLGVLLPGRKRLQKTTII
jgi:hypothetical protein